MDFWKGDACKTGIKCDPATSLCLFDVLDKDSDGHPPQVCGGDDCDDSVARVHPGATETCDGEDNDCNGPVDDGATCSDPLKACTAGACACKPENKCGSSCVDTSTSTLHCGTCGHACGTGFACIAGTCDCASPLSACGGSCLDTTGDPANCGACGNTCGGGTCSGGVCQCSAPRIACGATCVDSGTDPANCGGCGNVCTGGATCSSGRCVVVLLDALPICPTSIAVDPTSVYVALTGYGLSKLPLGGGIAADLAVGVDPYEITLDATNLYWTDGSGSVNQLSLAVGSPIGLASGAPYAIAVDATSVYWTDSGAVVKQALAGGGPITLASGSASYIAVDATSVYWTTGSDGTVMKVALGGGAPVVLASDQSWWPSDIAVDATSVYWTDDQSSELRKVPIGGGTPIVLAQAGHPEDIVVDATSVYWATSGGVMKVALNGGTPIVVAGGSPVAIAVDGTSVYWADCDWSGGFGTGAVMKAAK